MTGQIIEVDHDNSGLGRWSYVKFAGRHQRQITTLTAYCPCKQYNPGNSTINAQQYKVLRQQGINNPNPNNKWSKDLTPLLKQWKHGGKVLLLVDANSGLDEKDFTLFVSETELCNVMGGTHSIDTPNTHAEGSKTINFMLCSPNMLSMIKKCGMLWFYDGIHSDHRGIFAILISFTCFVARYTT
eukprot:995082-Ditylum_brightwellii.AAC.1